MEKTDERYSLILEKEIPECGARSRLYEHKKSGARIFTLKNSDKNKVFYIGFRTPPKDHTGVAHILEHSVLCGSEKFPLKDPFVELAKGSLNTFLNAMTYPDKTVYPVASLNDKDFMNLMDVYMDAVLHPNIYREKKIFEQEGWHYELSEEDERLCYNGVVYNEMKGEFSNPEAVLERCTMHALFPDTAYGFESGGDPEFIPELSYEAFLEFHGTYYHPSNSYIYLYGDMDMDEKLAWLDEKYLSAYEKKTVDSEIGLQRAFSVPQKADIEYPIGDNESLSAHTYLSENYALSEEADQMLYLALPVLDYVLLEAPGAPLKEAIVSAGIGEDVFGGFTLGLRQPYFSVIAKNAEASDKARFQTVIRETLSRIVTEGIDKKLLLAAVNYMEFKFREADYGRMPAGLVYGLRALDAWLYGRAPYEYLLYNDAFLSLRKQAEAGYFEGLIEKYLLDNPFSALVCALPKKGLLAEREEALQKKLAAKLKSFTAAERKAVLEETAALLRYQEEGSSEEALKTLPLLSVSDIGREAEKNYLKTCGKLLFSEFPTNGIAYIRVLFDTSGLSGEELQFASFLRYLYGELDTSAHTYRELAGEVLTHTGGLDFEMTSYPDTKEYGAYQGFFSTELRVLNDKIGQGLSLVSEILCKTLFSDEGRIGEKLLEAKSRMQMKLDGGSHSAAVVRAGSYFRADQRYEDLVSGIAFYDFLNAAAKFYQIPGKRKHFIKSLKQVSEKLFVKKNMCFALAGDKAAKQRMQAEMKAFSAEIPAAKPARKKPTEAELSAKSRAAVTAQGRLNEGFLTTSQVNYAAQCGSFGDKGLPYTGALLVLRGLLNYEYLWQNLRVKGGAYGCMAGFLKSGRGYLVSYRDPQLAETYQVYAALPAYLKALKLSERDMTKYIIGAISELDQPATASILASKYLSAYFSHITDEDFQRERDEVLGCTNETLKGLSAYAQAVLSDGFLCTVGNAGKIKTEQKLFASVRELY